MQHWSVGRKTAKKGARREETCSQADRSLHTWPCTPVLAVASSPGHPRLLPPALVSAFSTTSTCSKDTSVPAPDCAQHRKGVSNSFTLGGPHPETAMGHHWDPTSPKHRKGPNSHILDKERSRFMGWHFSLFSEILTASTHQPVASHGPTFPTKHRSKGLHATEGRCCQLDCV